MKTNFKSKVNLSVVLFWIIFLLGFALRVGKFFDGSSWLNQDEASIGYDTYALLKYGVDRNGISLPIHLVAWGSGQNALYAYLSMPFVAIFGLNTFSIRIVNLLASLGTIAAVYGICKGIYSKKVAFIAMGLTAIAPWNIMLAVWGLESNLFPAIFTFGLLFLVKALKRPFMLCFSAAIFALSLYSYGSAYAAVPIFLLISLIVVIKNKLIPIKWIIAAFSVFAIISTPIVLFILINKFGWNSICFGPFTIPAMTGKARINEIVALPNVKQLLHNLLNSVVLQKDDIILNQISPFGCIYLISVPFAFLGIIDVIKSKNIFHKFPLIAFGSCLVLTVFYEVININRVNCIYIPLIILAAIGISKVVLSMRFAVALICSYAILTTAFICDFYSPEYMEILDHYFYPSFEQAVTYADEISEGKTVNVTNRGNTPYIYVLFYTKDSPHEYYETVTFEEVDVEFQRVLSYGKWEFNIEGYFTGQPGIYIVNNEYVDFEKPYDIVTFEKYSVVTID